MKTLRDLVSRFNPRNYQRKLVKIDKLEKKKRKNVTKKIQKEMRALRKHGLGVKEISRKLGLSSSVVSYHLTLRTTTGKLYKMSPEKRKVQREKAQDPQIRARKMKERHENKTPKNHGNCPACFPENIPRGMKMEQALDLYINRIRKVNFTQYLWAKKNKIDGLKKEGKTFTEIARVEKVEFEGFSIVEETPAKDFDTHERVVPEEIKINQSIPTIWCPICHKKKVNCTCQPKGGFVN